MAHKQVDDYVSPAVVEGDLTILIKLTFYVKVSITLNVVLFPQIV